MASRRQRDVAWQNTPRVRGKNPNLYRRDVYGNEIYKPAYATGGIKGWEVDHSNPRSRGGTGSSRNLQAMQRKANRRKGAQYPYYLYWLDNQWYGQFPRSCPFFPVPAHRIVKLDISSYCSFVSLMLPSACLCYSALLLPATLSGDLFQSPS